MILPRFLIAALLVGCAQAAASPAPATCGDATGAWSPVTNGLRARLVTSGSKPDKSALDITLEVENVGTDPILLPWNGAIALGFAKFHLDDAQGNDVAPAWAFGGNEFTGEVRALFRPKTVIRYQVHNGAFETMSGKRALRIGAFWGRELPTDGSKRSLHATLTAGPPNAATLAYEGTELVRDPPPARTFVGTLDVPAVCVD